VSWEVTGLGRIQGESRKRDRKDGRKYIGGAP
jgi:hypothetical protein